MEVQEMEIVDGNQIPYGAGPGGKVAETEVIEPSIEERETAIALKENTFEAKEAFAKASIPESMLEFVVHADKVKQQENIEKFSKAWSAALKTAVKGRVASDPPSTPVRNVPYKTFSQLSYQERLDLKKASPETYARLAGKASK